MPYARILIDRTEGTLLDYAIPKELADRIAIGSRVRVPLRKAEVMGIVLSLHETIAFAHAKPISAVIDHDVSSKNASSLEKKENSPEPRSLISPNLMALAHWIADYYCASLDAVLRSVVPTTIRNDSLASKKKRVALLLKKPSAEALQELFKSAPKQHAILTALLVCEKKMVSLLLEETKASAASLKSLVKAEWISIHEEVIGRDPFAGEELLPSPIPSLNTDQERVVNIICEELTVQKEGAVSQQPVFKVAAADDEAGAEGAQQPSVYKILEGASTGATNSLGAAVDCEKRFSRPFLLHGVTGSGKTEVYLRAMERALALGKSVLILVPEIALTPQTVERFRARLERTKEKGFIAVLHSHLSQGERHDEWLRLHRGEARVVIGARSAVFAPLQNLGLIIVDEEHETSYKQEETPRYHARDVAVVRARLEGCVLVLGSATPSLESYHNTLLEKYRLLELPERADHQKMPLVRVLDLRLQGKQKGADSVLSFPLRQAMSLRLERSEQIILFLNRRGFSSALLCQQCGTACTCPNCSLSLTFHRVTERLVCHLCGYVEKPPTVCPKCHDPGILYSGIGTQRVEAAVRQAFPKARAFRIDADTMQSKGSYQETFDQFRKRQIDILIGTQMIAKGLDFPNVTLVGIINADTSLHAPDFRAGERTFQLLTQVAGRAGRGDQEGEVMVQTFTPASPSIQFARHHDYAGFFEQEIAFRKTLGYPPFQRMILVQVRSQDAEAASLHAMTLADHLKKKSSGTFDVGEAVPAPLEKAHGYYRFHVALRGTAIKSMKTTLQGLIKRLPAPPGVILSIDVDPQSLL